MKKNSIKNIRINQEMQRVLSVIISRQIKDPRIHPMTSVTAVDVAPDLKTCKAYISVLGDADAQEKTLEGLNRAIGFIRRELAHQVNLRNTPELTFVMDQSIAYGVDMAKKITEVITEDELAAANRPPEEPDPDAGPAADEMPYSDDESAEDREAGEADA